MKYVLMALIWSNCVFSSSVTFHFEIKSPKYLHTGHPTCGTCTLLLNRILQNLHTGHPACDKSVYITIEL